MLLVHDLGQIDTGDTIVFEREGWQERMSAERIAVERIFGMLPRSSGEAFVALWEEFEKAETVEARFAHAVDRAMPVFLNLNNDGGSWKEHGISYARVVERVGPEIEAGCDLRTLVSFSSKPSFLARFKQPRFEIAPQCRAMTMDVSGHYSRPDVFQLKVAASDRKTRFDGT